MSRSFTTSSSASFLPTPGMRVSIATSPATTVSRSSAGVIAESAASASFGPTPETAVMVSKAVFSPSVAKP